MNDIITSHHILFFSLGNPKPEGPDQEATHHRTAPADAMHNKILPFLIVPSFLLLFSCLLQEREKKKDLSPRSCSRKSQTYFSLIGLITGKI
ncbi:hypothetical protein BDV36DRAFT_275143 [Aspergillus pseudocaelatus]|uniref:Uncharacterized protein n=1 Tax=Aspergillus pseudocaelatus TaxID=1825620 RepID=A0ABQ6W2F3_9EURO|nr:hypothetical protein BDV36DRAFT_275143 [Aspergillus pseudocaelatus]